MAILTNIVRVALQRTSRGGASIVEACFILPNLATGWYRGTVLHDFSSETIFLIWIVAGIDQFFLRCQQYFKPVTVNMAATSQVTNYVSPVDMFDNDDITTETNAMQAASNLTTMAWSAITNITDTTSGSVSTTGSSYADTGKAGCDIILFTVEVVINPLVGIFGLIGNTLSCLVLWADRKTSPTALLLLALAIVDMLVIVGWVNGKANTAACRFISTEACKVYFKYYYATISMTCWSLNRYTSRN